jgi:hypothetical protein
VLALLATATARDALRSLRVSNAQLFVLVSTWIAEVRSDPAGPRAGRAFRLDDGTTARLLTFHDMVAGRDLAIIWILDEENGDPAMRIVTVQHV